MTKRDPGGASLQSWLRSGIVLCELANANPNPNPNPNPHPNPNPNPNQEEAEEQQRAACAASRLTALEEHASIHAGLEQQRASLRAQASPSYHP